MSRNGEYDEPRYIISIAAKLVDLHPQTLRHYESIGLLNPRRSVGNIRLYSQRDIERLRKISRLTDELGVNLAGVEIILNMGERMEDLQSRLAEAQEAMRADTMQLRSQIKQQILDAIHGHAPELGPELQKIVKELEKQLD